MRKESSKKQKLTLSVDSEIVEKARKLDINISEITEKVLDSFTFTPKKTDVDEVYSKYRQLFETMIPLLKNFGTSCLIGKFETTPNKDYPFEIMFTDLDLTYEGKLFMSEFDQWISLDDIENIPISFFHKPKKILSKLLESLALSQEARKENIADLEMANRIVQAITGQIKKPPQKIPHKKKRSKKRR